ncbi:MAG: hydratase [Coriobacteriia bacterium]|nr:hydratase [Coriobacteriia bacterium]MCL2750163.1 hydratase [Coriobacteriia bacterium]
MSIRYIAEPVILKDGQPVFVKDVGYGPDTVSGRSLTMSYRIMLAHQMKKGKQESQLLESKLPSVGQLHLTFDALISHDITYVGIIQTARASGMTEFPVPYTLTNCHNSLCAVGGTINEDDHVFGLSAAHKYGGNYVPANVAVIHQFARERLTGVGKMILGSDSHTRYGSYGCMGIGEGGGELAKQLLSNSYDLALPEVVLVWLTGAPRPGVGPHDVALALVGETFKDGRVKNKILEFAGPGIANLSMDYRAGIDVMTTETSCLSSIWPADITTASFYDMVGRIEDFKMMGMEEGSYYDAIVQVDLSSVEPMIALPFHPSKAYPIAELQDNAFGILKTIEDEANEELGGQVKLNLLSHIDKKGLIQCDQGIIVGCAGGLYENLTEAAAILLGEHIGNSYFSLSAYPASETIHYSITHDGTAARLLKAGTLLKPAFCGPCFGAGDTPSDNALSIRHATRNFANREGAKPNLGQVAGVALMDARSIAATALNGGRLTAATELNYEIIESRSKPQWTESYQGELLDNRCYYGFGQAMPSMELRLGPNIVDWPPIPPLGEDLLLELAAVIHDPVTTTDELIPSGETSSYRSNPLALAEFTLSRREPDYVKRAKHIATKAEQLALGSSTADIERLIQVLKCSSVRLQLASAIFATKPGDGSAREQAASCQKVLGGGANIAYEYATKRYRSNCINWGLVPFTLSKETSFDYSHGDFIFVPGIRSGILEGKEEFNAQIISGGDIKDITLYCKDLNPTERQILADGCLINYYANQG